MDEVGTYLRQASMQILAADLDTDWPQSMGKPHRIGDMPLMFVFHTVDEKKICIYGFCIKICMSFRSVNKPLVSTHWVRVMVKNIGHTQTSSRPAWM